MTEKLSDEEQAAIDEALKERAEYLEMLNKLDPDTKMQMSNPIAFFMSRACIFDTTDGLIAIPERNIDYLYTGPAETTILRTKSGKQFELEIDLLEMCEDAQG